MCHGDIALALYACLLNNHFEVATISTEHEIWSMTLLYKGFLVCTCMHIIELVYNSSTYRNMSWCQEGLANSNQVPGFHHQNPPPPIPSPPDVPGPPAVHQSAPPPPPTFQRNPLPPVPPELAPVNQSLPPDKSLTDQTLSHVPLPDRDHVHYKEEPAKSAGDLLFALFHFSPLSVEIIWAKFCTCFSCLNSF